MFRLGFSVNFKRSAIWLTTGWLCSFVLLPHLLVLVTSLLTPDSMHLIGLPMTLDNFSRTLDPIYLKALWQSVRLAGLATLVCLLVGYPFAWLVSGYSRAVRGWILFLMILPFWTNSLIRAYALKGILGKKGVINQMLVELGLVDQPLQLLFTDAAVVMGLVYILLPFMVLPLYAGFDKLDRKLLEVAQDLGASRWQRFRRIILPMTLPSVVAGTLIVFLPAMGLFYIADLLGGAKNLLLGNIIKQQFLVGRDWPLGAAISVVLMLVMGILLVIYQQTNRMINHHSGLDDENL
jgi:spermidine/putrescine transport system permease protein